MLKEVRRVLYIEDLVIRNHKGTAVIIFIRMVGGWHIVQKMGNG